MRPSQLDPLFASIRSLYGVGKQQAELLNRLLGWNMSGQDARLIDLLYLMPHSLVDRQQQINISELIESNIATLAVTVIRHIPPLAKKNRQPYRVLVTDHRTVLPILFFTSYKDWIKNKLPIGEKVIISGRIEKFSNELVMVHPDYIVPASQHYLLPKLEPIYPLTAGLSNKVLRKFIHNALKFLPDCPEWLPPNWQEQENFPSFKDALYRLHQPKTKNDIEIHSPYRRRLAFDEIFAYQFTLALNRTYQRQQIKRPQILYHNLEQKLQENLPYQLTKAQKHVIAEIKQDLSSTKPMYRLLQGDVGAGKTIIALFAMIKAVETGGQAAFMVPTEVLARQHLQVLERLCCSLPIKIALLTGREKGKQRLKILNDLQNGQINILIGTHALIQKHVVFKNLSLSIIDEQHRFGVHQRLQLSNQEHPIDLLFMTATPIPRTLVLTAFGDMDISKLDEKPVGRKPIQTISLPLFRLDELVTRLKNVIKNNEQIYWVCPLIEESEKINLNSAQERFTFLQTHFGQSVGFLHGQMRDQEKDEVLTAFLENEIKILVSTTVIEVGIDVPNAVIMVIEHAERFGLAQLHQLRGRVGRSDKDSTCILLYRAPLSQIAYQRLAIMRQTENGFLIAEKDLVLRGEGEILGTRQSGLPQFYFLQTAFHQDLIEKAHHYSQILIQQSPDTYQNLRFLLYLFNKDHEMQLIRAG